MHQNICRIFIFSTLIVGVYTQNEVVAPVIDFVRQNVKGLRRSTFEKVLGLIEDRGVKTIVETGTARGGELAFLGDGGFTIIFGYWCSLNNARLYSVDISERALIRAKGVTKKYKDYIDFTQDDSVNFLMNFEKPIEFLYLDSYDFDVNDPEPSQMHHLREIEVAYDKLTPNAIVMIDDCGLPHGGKGKYVIKYLLSKGWKIYAQSYQVIMLRG